MKSGDAIREYVFNLLKSGVYEESELRDAVRTEFKVSYDLNRFRHYYLDPFTTEGYSDDDCDYIASKRRGDDGYYRYFLNPTYCYHGWKEYYEAKEEYESKHLETVDIAWSLLEENVKLHDELLKRKKIKVKEEKCEPIKMTDEEWKQYFDDLLR